MAEEKSKTGGNKKPVRLILLLILVLGGLAGGLWWFTHRHLVTTDNAYVMADSAAVSSRVSGQILKVLVDNDDFVQKGQLLVELDPDSYRLRVEEAQARVNSLKAEYRLAQTELTYIDAVTSAALQEAGFALDMARNRKRQAMDNLKELQKKRKSAKADFGHAKKDFARYSALFAQKAVAERDFDRIRTAYKKALAQLEAIDAAIDAASKEVRVAEDLIHQAEARLLKAKAERLKVEVKKHELNALKAKINQAEKDLALAKLNLSYCRIKAPISGYVAQKNIQAGNFVQPGQPLMAIVPLRDVYVEANFKETQLTHMRIGQKAIIEADIYPGYKYYGRVIGIRAGTGTAFSLLPPENATGNWIKVVQRVPVKIRLDSPPPVDHPLRVGLSLEVTVDTSDRNGPYLRPPETAKAAFIEQNPS
ncbi:MAG TPA: HlyD family secretion protein [Thermodesulforhabdus norvegica]|uniref:HlyD family secretion protein n=1 Tax=Thermodesulforhabdus norvegica TaxID=39841 RepID=A0A7C0WUC5_9BACT|nr:HlyD family secretion protein [Thermodesulforhabdus norvegica]